MRTPALPLLLLLGAVGAPVPCDGDFTPTPEDVDGDGYTADEGDCNDEDGDVNPGVAEDCTDYVDNNCNGVMDFCGPEGPQRFSIQEAATRLWLQAQVDVTGGEPVTLDEHFDASGAGAWSADEHRDLGDLFVGGAYDTLTNTSTLSAAMKVSAGGDSMDQNQVGEARADAEYLVHFIVSEATEVSLYVGLNAEAGEYDGMARANAELTWPDGHTTFWGAGFRETVTSGGIVLPPGPYHLSVTLLAWGDVPNQQEFWDAWGYASCEVTLQSLP